MLGFRRDRERIGADHAEDRARGCNGDDQTGRGRCEQGDDDERGSVVAGGQVEGRRQRPEACEGRREPRPNGRVLQIALVGTEL